MKQMAGDWTLPPISNQQDTGENGKSVNMVVLRSINIVDHTQTDPYVC